MKHALAALRIDGETDDRTKTGGERNNFTYAGARQVLVPIDADQRTRQSGQSFAPPLDLDGIGVEEALRRRQRVALDSQRRGNGLQGQRRNVGWLDEAYPPNMPEQFGDHFVGEGHQRDALRIQFGKDTAKRQHIDRRGPLWRDYVARQIGARPFRRRPDLAEAPKRQ